MIKKIVLISLFVLFAAVLIGGGIYRTSAKSGYDISLGGENIVEISQNPDSVGPRNEQRSGTEEHQQGGERAGQGLGNGGAPQGRNEKTEEFAGERQADGQGGQGQGNQGSGQGQNRQAESTEGGQGQGGQGQGNQGSGQGQNRQAENTEGGQGQGGQGQGNQGSGQGQNRQTETAQVYESVLIEGTISQAPAAGVDMIIETAGGQVLVGTGPGYLQEQGFDLAVGDAVQVSGYFEGDEFKATTITRLSDGAAIDLRDESGRPMWSGAGRRANSGENQGNGQGSQGSGQNGI